MGSVDGNASAVGSTAKDAAGFVHLLVDVAGQRGQGGGAQRHGEHEGDAVLDEGDALLVPAKTGEGGAESVQHLKFPLTERAMWPVGPSGAAPSGPATLMPNIFRNYRHLPKIDGNSRKG